VSVYGWGMDELVGLLDGARARGAFVLRSLMSPPWSVRIEDQAPVSLVIVVQGEAWVTADDIEPTRVGAGDLAIVSGTAPYTYADDPATPPQAVIHPGQHCTTPDGRSLTEAMTLGVRSWGNDPDGTTRLLIGTYEKAGEVSQRLVGALPRLLVLREPDWETPLVGVLAAEIVRDEPGQEVVLDRLLDLVLVGALRAWFAREAAASPPRFRAAADPLVAPAMQLLQNQPERPWTVASLAHEVGVSRAALARRFTEVVGEPPMTFLTSWRLALAADLLRDTDATIGSVAAQVGYGSPFALSTAFKRTHGVSPTQYRRTGPLLAADRARASADA
jgi:AraC-like DNA-binding protein